MGWMDALFVTCIVFWPVREIPLQSWRLAKDLEEQFVFYTAQYAKLLDLVSHPCRLLYKVTKVKTLFHTKEEKSFPKKNETAK